MSGDLPIPVHYGIASMLYDPQAGISTLLVNELAKAGFPALVDGRIAFGQGSTTTRQGTPRIIAEWVGSGATGVEYGAEFVRTGGKATAPVMNALGTDLLRIAYHVWASSPQPDPLGDADACRYLCHQLWRVIHRVAIEGAYNVLGIETEDQTKTSLGFHAIMTVEHRTVVPDNLISYAPHGLKPAFVVFPNGAPASDQITVRSH